MGASFRDMPQAMMHIRGEEALCTHARYRFIVVYIWVGLASVCLDAFFPWVVCSAVMPRPGELTCCCVLPS